MLVDLVRRTLIKVANYIAELLRGGAGGLPLNLPPHSIAVSSLSARDGSIGEVAAIDTDGTVRWRALEGEGGLISIDFSELTGIATKAQLPDSIAYEDEENIFTEINTFEDVVIFNEITTPSATSVDTIGLHAVDMEGFSALETVDETSLHIRLSRDNVRIVRNSSSSDMTRGQLVALLGSIGSSPAVELADAADPTLSASGILLEDIDKNTFGRMLVLGVISDLNTNIGGLTEGDTLYLSDTPGEYTNVPPVGATRQVIGLLTRKHPNQGVIDIDIGTGVNRVFLPAAIAYEDEANIFTEENRFGNNVVIGIDDTTGQTVKVTQTRQGDFLDPGATSKGLQVYLTSNTGSFPFNQLRNVVFQAGISGAGARGIFFSGGASGGVALWGGFNSAGKFIVNEINEITAAAGVLIDGVLLKDGLVGKAYLPAAIAYEDEANTFTDAQTFSHATTPILTNVIVERTAAAGVTIDGVLAKDGKIVVVDGTIALPSIIASSDTGTGISFSGGSVVNISLGGSLVASFATGNSFIDEGLIVGGDIDTINSGVLLIQGTQVMGAQGAAVADASGGTIIDAEARTAINTLLARSRAHGFIAT
jgi:hypothetical protein